MFSNFKKIPLFLIFPNHFGKDQDRKNFIENEWRELKECSLSCDMFNYSCLQFYYEDN